MRETHEAIRGFFEGVARGGVLEEIDLIAIHHAELASAIDVSSVGGELDGIDARKNRGEAIGIGAQPVGVGRKRRSPEPPPRLPGGRR